MLTENRRKILETISGSPVPMHAREVYIALNEDINLATVYRAVNFLEKRGLIEGFTFSCSDEGTVRYFFSAGHGHTHFFHCTRCHSFTGLKECSLDSLIKRFEEKNGHQVDTHVMYLSGICRDCREKQAREVEI
ncbi:MAG: Fur family transcriptional regulator [Spirochaetia bacterium]